MGFALVYFFCFSPQFLMTLVLAEQGVAGERLSIMCGSCSCCWGGCRLAQEPGTGEDAQTPPFPISQFIWMHRQERRLLQSQPSSLLTAESEWNCKSQNLERPH